MKSPAEKARPDCAGTAFLASHCQVARFDKDVPLGRAGQPNEVAP
jgi:hypothetical protein